MDERRIIITNHDESEWDNKDVLRYVQTLYNNKVHYSVTLVQDAEYRYRVESGSRYLSCLYNVLRGLPCEGEWDCLTGLWYNCDTEELAWYDKLRMEQQKGWLSVAKTVTAIPDAGWIEKLSDEQRRNVRRLLGLKDYTFTINYM